MAKERGQSLAARLRAVIENRATARAQEAEAAAERRLWVQQQRSQLLEDLQAFGDAIGHISVSAKKGALVFGYEGRELRFTAKNRTEHVAVRGTDVPSQVEVVMQEELKRWVVRIPSTQGPSVPDRVEQMLLFDTGLEELMSTALGLRQ